ncbi:TetR/AcrR family transcriptional regulator [Actinospongicola halichondriae]|uniref:TetR/AcrR family transcriptional regulator n=1 Tax=Actinospongicola halichondriae TaxID=3236844 RepID=UPI003D4DF075
MGRRSADEVRACAIAGAAECFRELGIASTSVDDIVAVSGVARSTLYRHIGDRNDLLLAVTLAEIDDLQAELVKRADAGGSVVDLLVEGVLDAVDLVQSATVLHELVTSPALITSEVSDHAMQSLVARLHDFVGPLLEDPAIRPDLDPDVAVEFLVRTITSLVTLGVRGEPSPATRRNYLRQTLGPVFVADEVLADV